MERVPHQNVATVLVDPAVLRELEMHLMTLDLWVWPIATAPVSVDGPRQAFQVRRRLLEAKRGAWDLARDWTPVWIAFGDSWYDGADPLPWAAHRMLWSTLEQYAEHVRYRLGLGGIPRIDVPHERTA